MVKRDEKGRKALLNHFYMLKIRGIVGFAYVLTNPGRA
jgi:hypothetical protein